MSKNERSRKDSNLAAEPLGEDVSKTQAAKLKDHLMGLDPLAPLDPEDIAEELEMEVKYVNQLFGRLENAMVVWQNGVLVRMEDPINPDSPGEVLRSARGGVGIDESGGRQMSTRHRRTSL